MKKRYILLIVGLLLFTSSIYTQTKLTGSEKTNFTRFLNKGVEYFQAERSSDALESLKKAEAIDPENWKLNYWLAACHHALSSYLTAEQYINNAKKNMGEKEEGDAEFYELEGKINHRLGQIENASSAYKKAAIIMGTKMAKEYGISQYLDQCELVLKDRKEGIVLSRKPLSVKINTVEDEYAPILFNHGKVLFFTARRPETKGENLNPDDLRFFEDMYRANWNSKTQQYEMDYAFFDEINTNGFDALSYVNSAGTYALMTINTSLAEKTTKSSDIFEIVSEDTLVWESPTVIKSKGVNTEYFEGGACATEGAEDGDFLVFISDRKADVSGTDLYTCRKNETGYGEVTPLPKHINSPGNETTPWLTADGKYLFFSSDELPGYGGYDVFYSVNEAGVWSAPINLGTTVNTVNNDTHFRLIGDGPRAIYASFAEQSGFFSYDLFELDLNGGTYPFLK
jgi:tetratricopeptide (TPR) repeat protein